jgi:hypothetical protein
MRCADPAVRARVPGVSHQGAITCPVMGDVSLFACVIPAAPCQCGVSHQGAPVPMSHLSSVFWALCSFIFALLYLCVCVFAAWGCLPLSPLSSDRCHFVFILIAPLSLLCSLPGRCPQLAACHCAHALVSHSLKHPTPKTLKKPTCSWGLRRQQGAQSKLGAACAGGPVQAGRAGSAGRGPDEPAGDGAPGGLMGHGVVFFWFVGYNKN